MLKTFAIVTLAWIFFRAASIQDSFNYIKNLFTNTYYDKQFFSKVGVEKESFYVLNFFILFMLVVEWLNRTSSFGLMNLPKNIIIRYLIYIFLCLAILQFFSGESEFIYFQF